MINMMSNAGYLLIVLFLLGLIGFIFPFIRQIWVKPAMHLWGFYVGARKRKMIFKHISLDKNLSSQTQGNLIDIYKRHSEENLNAELQELETMHNSTKDDINKKIDDIEKKIEKRKKNFSEWINNREIKKRFKAIENHVLSSRPKNLILLFIIAVIIFIDTLIAKQIFQSLGMFTEILEIFGERIEAGYQYIYGLFITVVIAFFLHFTLKIDLVNDFFHSQKFKLFNRMGPKVVFLIFFSIFSLLLLAVLLPDSSKSFLEIVMRICWLIGVLVVYWLIDQILGQDNDYIQLIFPLIIILLALGWIFFGFFSILQLLGGNIVQFFFELSLNINKMRLKRKSDNEELRYSCFNYGIRRGFNF